jgi:hypothetical protein
MKYNYNKKMQDRFGSALMMKLLKNRLSSKDPQPRTEHTEISEGLRNQLDQLENT